MAVEKIKKVKATIKEVYVEPDYEATYECPYCGRKHYDEVYDEDTTIEKTCWNKDCKKKFKVKIPKFY